MPRAKLHQDLLAPRSEQETAQAQRLVLSKHGYNLSLWPYLGGVIAALFGILFTLYAIVRARTAQERHFAVPSAVPSSAPDEAPLIWIDY